jgi:hypothetical protein
LDFNLRPYIKVTLTDPDEGWEEKEAPGLRGGHKAGGIFFVPETLNPKS